MSLTTLAHDHIEQLTKVIAEQLQVAEAHAKKAEELNKLVEELRGQVHLWKNAVETDAPKD